LSGLTMTIIEARNTEMNREKGSIVSWEEWVFPV